MAKVLMVVAQQGFRDEELLVPQEILRHGGHDVKVASITRARASGVKGASVMPDFAAHEVNPDFFDALVIVGGPGSLALSESEDVLRLVRGASAKGKVVSAICMGPVTLARSGVLAGKRATVFRSQDGVRALKEGGARYTGEDVTVDGRLVTACGPEAANDFGRALLEALRR